MPGRGIRTWITAACEGVTRFSERTCGTVVTFEWPRKPDRGATRWQQVRNYTSPRGAPKNVSELEDIRKLFDLVIHATTKATAKHHIARLNSAILDFKPRLDPYFAGKLSEAADYAAEASGQVRNKEHWISCMERSWYVVESHVRSKSSDPADR